MTGLKTVGAAVEARSAYLCKTRNEPVEVDGSKHDSKKLEKTYQMLLLEVSCPVLSVKSPQTSLFSYLDDENRPFEI